MAVFVFTDASLTVGGTDLSDHIQSVTLNYEAETQDDTVMGDSTRSNIGGLKNWSIDVTWAQDYAASEVDATLFSLVGTSTALVLKPTSGAVSATNPSYSGNGILSSYTPLSGSVGDFAQATSSFVPAGDLSRNTS